LDDAVLVTRPRAACPGPLAKPFSTASSRRPLRRHSFEREKTPLEHADKPPRARATAVASLFADPKSVIHPREAEWLDERSRIAQVCGDAHDRGRKLIVGQALRVHHVGEIKDLSPGLVHGSYARHGSRVRSLRLQLDVLPVRSSGRRRSTPPVHRLRQGRLDTTSVHDHTSLWLRSKDVDGIATAALAPSLVEIGGYISPLFELSSVQIDI
jgi:hypothetical protein